MENRENDGVIAKESVLNFAKTWSFCIIHAMMLSQLIDFLDCLRRSRWLLNIFWLFSTIKSISNWKWRKEHQSFQLSFQFICIEPVSLKKSHFYRPESPSFYQNSNEAPQLQRILILVCIWNRDEKPKKLNDSDPIFGAETIKFFPLFGSKSLFAKKPKAQVVWDDNLTQKVSIDPI